MGEAWSWAVLGGLGAYHGLNPAMGWLFAVALGLHRRSRAVVLQSLIPIALGHAAAIALVAGLVVAAGLVVDPAAIRVAGAAALAAWALYRLAGARHRTRVGMQAGFAGLAAWSFLMAGAHGAGLMLVPALLPLCFAPGADASVMPPALAVGVHTAAMLAVTAVLATLVYEWIGVDFLRRGWINLEWLWTAALLATAVLLLV